MDKHTSNDSSTMHFFAIIGLLGMGFGACIPLFNLAYSHVESALLGVFFILLGATCSMFALGKFLAHLDDAYVAIKNKSH